MKVKPRGNIYSINEGYERLWDEAVREYVASKKHPKVRYREISRIELIFCSLDWQGLWGPLCRLNGGRCASYTQVWWHFHVSSNKRCAQWKGDLIAILFYCFMIDSSPSTSLQLRLMYEGNPMAYIIENAGGLASTGNGGAILDVQPKSIHERVPVFLGSREDVQDLINCYKSKA